MLITNNEYWLWPLYILIFEIFGEILPILIFLYTLIRQIVHILHSSRRRSTLSPDMTQRVSQALTESATQANGLRETLDLQLLDSHTHTKDSIDTKQTTEVCFRKNSHAK